MLSTLVVSLTIAFLGGVVARAIRLPPMLGYLVAGIVVGPFTPGFIADQAIANELAEIGVALLLFGVGLHFSFRDLLAVRTTAVPGALVQIAASTAIGWAVAAWVLGLDPVASVIVGLSLAIASTAVATRALDQRGQLTAPAGRMALGWLVVQDMVVILALVLIPALGSGAATAGDFAVELGRAVLQLVGFVVIILVVGRRAIPALLGYVARLGSRELFTLAVVVIALGIAWGASLLFGISLALAAFFAGVVLGESDLNHHAAAEALPMQHVFAVLFFVSAGMLFDPATIVRMPLEIATLVVTIGVGTGLVTMAILLVLRASPETAGVVGATFAQIGEFSFILSDLAVRHGLLPGIGRDLVLAAALVAIMLNPLMFPIALRVAAWLGERPAVVRWRDHELLSFTSRPGMLVDHAILVGHGRVGSTVATALRRHGLDFVVVESDRRLAERLRDEGTPVVYGDASRPEVLGATFPELARLIVVALPDAFHARRVIALARALNPTIETVVRTHSDAEALYLADAGVGLAVMGEREIAFGMSDFALQRLGVSAEEAQDTVNRLRARARPEASPA
ncbi:cation:proton antiporter [Rhodoplanes sp. TEM]|uniref:Cation:proton antiporter n=1 Tax=Rhodoplanes tepidamans TaxID=200616 RepID=A0ABT5J7Z5_RHOTP|nr:cation:proton antiporter [Rhodoplanes tepidamans]MDC7785711.1 cation:proton antiporter [Rhodoplanes tepidamans]MDC7983352.1 cation:proton antiporter [Rhodoplanes sp. TEM]MDQ0354720.1 CPA2 family monovalent cation:H+ antiporter-2 [Rhodoplanes tepidamans]